jgi:hypothetical protein
MLKPFIGLTLMLATLAPPAAAQSLRGDTLYRTTLLRAAPGRLLDLIGALKAKGVGSAGSKGLLLRHAQGDHWDLMILQQVAGYAQVLKDERPAPLAPPELVAWQEEEFVRGPDLETLPAFRDANLYHAEMFHALADKRAELLKEREMENAYAGALGRPQTAIFVRELGGSWDSFTLGAYKGWKHYAERDDIPKEKSASAAKAAGFSDVDQIGPYLRSLILDHHDSLLTPVR